MVSTKEFSEGGVDTVSEPILEEQELGGAGLALLKLIDDLTGYSRAMAERIQELALAVAKPEVPIPVDRNHRDDHGRFLSEYNAPRPRTDPQVGAVFDSVALKRENKDLTRLTLRTLSVENIQAKLLALMALPVVKEFDRDRDRDGHSRLFITSLDAPQIADLCRVEGRTPWRPYRDGDRIAGGFIELVDSHEKKAPPYRARVILLERRGKFTVSGYVTNAPATQEPGREAEGFEDEQLARPLLPTLARPRTRLPGTQPGR
ncbi:MAG: hypothetical protein HY814_14720 [Candidatus Riflebacteria bacterium]|nr:hypothetical protein [Candidatus Riflebacteria bacterium]